MPSVSSAHVLVKRNCTACNRMVVTVDRETVINPGSILGDLKNAMRAVVCGACRREQGISQVPSAKP